MTKQWKHKKRGTLYKEIGLGTLQASCRDLIEDDCKVMIYQGEDGQLWVREITEFNDGRFEEVPCAQG